MLLQYLSKFSKNATTVSMQILKKRTELSMQILKKPNYQCKFSKNATTVFMQVLKRRTELSMQILKKPNIKANSQKRNYLRKFLQNRFGLRIRLPIGMKNCKKHKLENVYFSSLCNKCLLVLSYLDSDL